MGDSEQNIKVAVRVRPFTKRELQRGAKLIVKMEGNQTTIIDPSGQEEPRKFAYDYSYWSFDGYKERSDGYLEADSSHVHGSKFADQQRVFQDLGQGVLKNAWDGYNSTLFAYGQTGSGKSYSVIGFDENKGIVPLFCERLFTEMDQRKDEGEYEVTLSMMEIYNEHVRDLLNYGKTSKSGLKIREHPKHGFYAQNLTMYPVDNFAAIEKKMTDGKKNRSIASTNMNETSSRAHTIVGIHFVQKRKNAGGKEVTKSSVSNLVDLAGSERVEKSGATGSRLKEGAAINLSLTSLGNCIKALADKSSGKKVKVPYRDSVLTKLLMNALGGNSKTVMVAAISPADENYEESVSTLRFADRAKQIRTRATVNEDPTEKLVRELQEENAKLMALLQGKGIKPNADGALESKSGDDDEEEDLLRAQLAENQRQMALMQQSFQERLQQALEHGGGEGEITHAEMMAARTRFPHLYNLNMDPQLSGMIVHWWESGGAYRIGNPHADPEPDIVLVGPSIQPLHAVIKISEDFSRVSIEKGSENARILINGACLVDQQDLSHHDRVLLGSTQLYVFANPVEAKTLAQARPPVTWEMAEEEIVRFSGGFDDSDDEKTSEDMIVQDELVRLVPAVEHANAISEALDKMTKFEVMLVPPEALSYGATRPEIYVRARSFTNGLAYDWSKSDFMNRYYVMQEMYRNYTDGDPWELPEDQDPFLEPADQPTRIGTVNVYLKSLAYIIETKVELEITEFRGNEVGFLQASVTPCTKKGVAFTEDDADSWIDNPHDLVGRDLHFLFRIKAARGLPPRFNDVMAKYTVYRNREVIEIPKISDTSNPEFNHEKLFSFKPVTEDILAYFMEGKILVELWGIQLPIFKKFSRQLSTSHMMQADLLAKGNSVPRPGQRHIDMQKVAYQMEAHVLKKRGEKMDQKITYLREMVNHGNNKGFKAIPLNFVRGMLDAPSEDVLKKWLALYQSREASDSPMSNGTGVARPSSASKVSSSRACVIM